MTRTDQGFEVIGHTSEVGFRAYGESMDEAFENAGRALFSLMAPLDTIPAEDPVSFTVESENLKALLYDYIDELIYRRDVEQMLFSRFQVTIQERDDGFALDATVTGASSSDITAQDVKAVTYSDMEINEDEDGSVVLQVIVDV